MTSLEDPCGTPVTSGSSAYGGLDVVYHRGWTRWLGDEPAAWSTMARCLAARNPAALRLLFLGAMAVPYGKTTENVRCRTRGYPRCHMAHRRLSDAAASVWCVANVAQGILMLCELTGLGPRRRTRTSPDSIASRARTLAPPASLRDIVRARVVDCGFGSSRARFPGRGYGVSRGPRQTG